MIEASAVSEDIPAKKKKRAKLEEASAFLAKHNITINAPPGVESTTPIISFSQLDIPEKLRIAFSGFKEPTPIQACTWPLAMEGYDIVGIAETGR